MIELLGISIHDPDVVFTDLALALLGAYFGWRLWGRAATWTGAVMMGGLASAAFWGAIFHAFFPAGTATTPGFIAWVPVTLSIVSPRPQCSSWPCFSWCPASRRVAAERSWRRTPWPSRA